MRVSLFFAVLSFVAAACAAPAAPDVSPTRRVACAPEPLVFADVLVWDGERFVADVDVVVDAGRIVGVGRQVRRPRGARVVSGRGMTLLPGLVDSHTHFGPMGPVGLSGARTMNGTGAATLASGVTTARVHMFDSERGPAFARNAEAACFPTPRLRLGGPALVGGAPELNSPVMVGVANPEDAVAKIRAARAIGASWIAVHDIDKFPPDVLRAIAMEAHASGVRLMVAAETRQQLELGLQVGAGTLEYGLGEIAYDLSDIKRYQGVTFSIPLGYYRNLIAMRRDPSRIDDPRPYRFMTQENSDRERQRVISNLAGAEPISQRELQYETVAANFRALHAAGASIVIASDSGSTGQFHTDAIWNEMAAWRAAGIGVDDILRAATSKPAAMLGETDIGRIGAGARADLVLYHGDIRDGGFDPRLVDIVVKDGALVVEHGELAASLR